MHGQHIFVAKCVLYMALLLYCCEWVMSRRRIAVCVNLRRKPATYAGTQLTFEQHIIEICTKYLVSLDLFYSSLQRFTFKKNSLKQIHIALINFVLNIFWYEFFCYCLFPPYYSF